MLAEDVSEDNRVLPGLVPLRDFSNQQNEVKQRKAKVTTELFLNMEKQKGVSFETVPPQQITIRSLVSEFASSTTAHGIGRIAAASTSCRRTFWTLASLAFYVALCYMCIELIVLFKKKPVISRVEVVLEERINFPAVTICNLNMLRMKDVHRSGVIDDFLKHVSKEENVGGKSTARPPKLVPNVMKNASSIDYKISRWKESRQKLSESRARNTKEREFMKNVRVDQSLLRFKYFDRVIKSLSETQRVYMGHNFEEMVKRCRWSEYSCDEGSLKKMWRHFWHWKYGNCYTFNSGLAANGEETPVLRVGRAGPYAGLELMLFVDQPQYTTLSDEAGIRVALTDQGKMPFPFEDGFSVAPGFSTSVSVRKVHTQRVDVFRNKSCLDENKDDFYKEKYNVSYSVQACLKYCIAERITEICNCSEPRYPTNDSSCLSEEEDKCAEKVVRSFNTDEESCTRKCPQLCSENTFRYTVSSSQWSTHFIDKLRHRLSSHAPRPPGPRPPRGAFQIKDNVLKLKIFYEEMTVEKIIHQEAYKIENLLADIGGHFGLWIGVSVMTIAELLELTVSLIGVVLDRTRRRNTER